MVTYVTYVTYVINLDILLILDRKTPIILHQYVKDLHKLNVTYFHVYVTYVTPQLSSTGLL